MMNQATFTVVGLGPTPLCLDNRVCNAYCLQVISGFRCGLCNVHSCDCSDETMDNTVNTPDERGEEEVASTAGRAKKKTARFSAGHDVLLLREVIAQNPYAAAAGEVTTTWAAIAASLNAAEAAFNIDGRRCRDRTGLLLDYFRKNDTASLRRSVLQNDTHFCDLLRFK